MSFQGANIAKYAGMKRSAAIVNKKDQFTLKWGYKIV